MNVPAPVQTVRNTVWRGDAPAPGRRAIPEETAVAFTYDGSAYAVMMATPSDLEDFAVGFSLTEGAVTDPSEIAAFEIITEDVGIELRLGLAEPRSAALAERRRTLAGPVGCGLCGIESLGEAMRPVPSVGMGPAVPPSAVFAAVDAIKEAQAINQATHAVHAAAFWTREAGLVAVREDVGRHNAFDKLAGALARRSIAAADGLIVLTSRLSVELVQKAAMIGAPILVAVSAPTALAVRTADAAGMTLVAVARGDGFEVFTHPGRIARQAALNPKAHVPS